MGVTTNDEAILLAVLEWLAGREMAPDRKRSALSHLMQLMIVIATQDGLDPERIKSGNHSVGPSLDSSLDTVSLPVLGEPIAVE